MESRKPRKPISAELLREDTPFAPEPPVRRVSRLDPGRGVKVLSVRPESVRQQADSDLRGEGRVSRLLRFCLLAALLECLPILTRLCGAFWGP